MSVSDQGMAVHTPALNIRVYYEDTDAGGVVFYANYLKYMERARTEWLRAFGVNQSELARHMRCQFVVHKLDMIYHKPALFDDLLTVRSRVTRLGRASLHFGQRIERDSALLVEGNVRVCCVGVDTLRGAPMPDALYHRLQTAVQP